MRRIITKNPYFKRILLTLIMVNLVPTIFLIVSLLNLLRQQRSYYNQNLITMAGNHLERTEADFKQTENALIELSLDTDTGSILRTDLQARDFQMFARMRERLQRIANSDLELEDVFILNHDKSWIIGSTICEPLESYGDQEMVKKLSDVEKSSFWYSDDRYIYLVKRLPIHMIPGTGMLIARFYRTAVEMEEQNRKDGHSLLVLDEDGGCVYGDEDLYAAVRVETYRDDWESGQDSWTTRARFHGTEYVLTVQHSDYNGWTYVMVTPNSMFAKNLNQVLLLLGVLSLGMICTDGYIIYIGSKGLYSPIHEMDSMMEIPDKDLELVDKVKYILNQNREMKKSSEMEKLSAQQLFLRKLYWGEQKNVREADLKEYGVTDVFLGDKNLYLMAIQFNDSFSSEEDRSLYTFALNNILEELLERNNRFPLLTMGQIIYTVYYPEADSLESANLKVQSVANLCIRAAKQYLGMAINVGISRCFHQLDQVNLAVRECEKALRDISGDMGICSFYQYQWDAEGAGLQSQASQARKRIIQAIDSGEYEVCERCLGDYLGLLQGMKYYRLKLELAALLSDIINIYETYALVPDTEKIEDVIEYDIGKRVNSMDVLREYLLDNLIRPLFLNIHEKKDWDDVIYQITKYLNENLEKNINLNECARHFNYNPNYLSRLFKKKFGKTYTDYVTEKRIERCEELLLETDISVNELAERFGYSSAQNFIRVFKKYTLVTPGQFRKSRASGEKEESENESD